MLAVSERLPNPGRSKGSWSSWECLINTGAFDPKRMAYWSASILHLSSGQKKKRKKTTLNRVKVKEKSPYYWFSSLIMISPNTVNNTDKYNSNNINLDAIPNGESYRTFSVIIKRNLCLRIVTWNIRIMLQIGKLQTIKWEMKN